MLMFMYAIKRKKYISYLYEKYVVDHRAAFKGGDTTQASH